MNGILGKILIFGTTGQVGSACAKILGSRAIALTREQADFSNPQSLKDVLKQWNSDRLSAVINCAAFTQVDLAEREEDLAFKINAEAPGVIAEWCKERDVPFVHFSTDYVFSGVGEKPWGEDAETGPLNVYGRSKLEGENRIRECWSKYLIFRTSWVYDENGKNFFKTMLNLGENRETLEVVSDQFGAPTYAPDLAQAALQCLEAAMGKPKFPFGVYHLCHAGTTTWHQFAEAIFSAARAKGIPLHVKKVHPILTKNYPTPAKRPVNSRLNTDRAFRAFEVRLPDWRVGLKAAMEHIL
ncbi:MAG: dTDP-4-dehydrorhamnose reductase [Bdellovibrionota bacterium]